MESFDSSTGSTAGSASAHGAGDVSPRLPSRIWPTCGPPGRRSAGAAGRTRGPGRTYDEVALLPPIDGDTEVWAAGVHLRPLTVGPGGGELGGEVYELVYDAERPELFVKSVAWRVVTDGEPIGIRRDSEVKYPRPSWPWW